MQLTVIFVEPAIRSTDGHVAGLAVLDTPALGLAGVPVEHTPAAPAAGPPLAGCAQPVLPGERWGQQTTAENATVSHIRLNTAAAAAQPRQQQEQHRFWR